MLHITRVEFEDETEFFACFHKLINSHLETLASMRISVILMYGTIDHSSLREKHAALIFDTKFFTSNIHFVHVLHNHSYVKDAQPIHLLGTHSWGLTSVAIIFSIQRKKKKNICLQVQEAIDYTVLLNQNLHEYLVLYVLYTY